MNSRSSHSAIFEHASRFCWFRFTSPHPVVTTLQSVLIVIGALIAFSTSPAPVLVAAERPLSAADLDTLWESLGSAQPGVAEMAVRKLAEAPTASLQLIEKRLAPHFDVVAAAQVPQLLSQLDDDRFAVREQAAEQLVVS